MLIFSAILVLFFVLTSTPSLVEGFQVRRVQQKKVPLLKLPDLVISNFSIMQGSKAEVGNMVSFTYSAVVKNIGTANVTGTYYVSIERYSTTAKRWEPSGLYISQNCAPLSFPLNPGQSRSFSKKLYLLDTEISNQTARLRAVVDTGCNEELPATWAHIKEIREDNNFSNEDTVSGGFYPRVTSVSPVRCVMGVDQVNLNGNNFGRTQEGHTVRLKKGNFQERANILSWYEGLVQFKAPANIDPGIYKVCIADNNNLQSLSNEVDLTVCKVRVMGWDDILFQWNLLSEAGKIKIHLHTYEGSRYNNKSFIRIEYPKKTVRNRIDVPLIQFHKKALGDYRYLVKDMDSQDINGVTLNRNNCSAQQIKMEIVFESGGRELKGYFRTLGPTGRWVDGSAPDVELNNGLLRVTFNFTANQTAVDYTTYVQFNADVNASAKGADWIMNQFMNKWNAEVRKKISDGVKAGMENQQNKTFIINSILDLVKQNLSLTNRTITKIEIKQEGAYVGFFVTYY